VWIYGRWVDARRCRAELQRFQFRRVCVCVKEGARFVWLVTWSGG